MRSTNNPMRVHTTQKASGGAHTGFLCGGICTSFLCGTHPGLLCGGAHTSALCGGTCAGFLCGTHPACYAAVRAPAC